MTERPAPAPGYRVVLRCMDSEGCPISEHEASMDELAEVVWIPEADGLHSRLSKSEATAATWDHYEASKAHGILQGQILAYKETADMFEQANLLVLAQGLRDRASKLEEQLRHEIERATF